MHSNNPSFIGWIKKNGGFYFGHLYHKGGVVKENFTISGSDIAICEYEILYALFLMGKS